MEVPTFASRFDASLVLGKKVAGYSPESHGAALLLDDGTALGLIAEEHSAGHWFEVFTLGIRTDAHERAWKLFPVPLSVEQVTSLWRFEWLVEGASGPTLGGNPKTQYAGRGPIPAAALSAARVEAGVVLKCASGNRVFAAASATSPFAVDVAVDQREISKTLNDFLNTYEA